MRINEDKYDYKNVIQDNPFYLYDITIMESDRKILTGKIYTTDHYGVYKEIFSRNKNFYEIFKLDTNKERPRLTDLLIKENIIDDYCKVMHMDRKKYHNKYGDCISAMLANFLIPAKLTDALGLKNKTYIFREQNIELYSEGIYNNKLEIFGDKRERSDSCKFELMIKNFNNNLFGNKTYAWAI